MITDYHYPQKMRKKGGIVKIEGLLENSGGSPMSPNFAAFKRPSLMNNADCSKP